MRNYCDLLDCVIDLMDNGHCFVGAMLIFWSLIFLVYYASFVLYSVVLTDFMDGRILYL